MTEKNKQTTHQNKRQPNAGWLYLQGLALYIGFRLAAVGEAVITLLTAPFRWSWSRLEKGWFRLKPWLIRNKRRLIWSALALTFLTLLVGGGLTLYLWRDELSALAYRLQGYLATIVTPLRRQAEPIIVVATQISEEVPVVPSVDGVGH